MLGNTLWNCIGGGTEGVQPDVYHATLRAGDELLLCTDGLNRFRLTDSHTSQKILARSSMPEVAVGAAPITAANEAGGEDNITAIVARVRPVMENDATPPDGIAIPVEAA